MRSKNDKSKTDKEVGFGRNTRQLLRNGKRPELITMRDGVLLSVSVAYYYHT
ncbi:MAG: hypothetical protein LBB72_07345 [Spirochaetaceae bacterium]|nr:hypothetical protein [Spirochaetaceae bacterium]